MDFRANWFTCDFYKIAVQQNIAEKNNKKQKYDRAQCK